METNGLVLDEQESEYKETWRNVVRRAVISKGVTGIGVQAFMNCKYLERVEMPASIKTIGSEAFRGCSALKEITIPQNTKEIGKAAFFGYSALEHINLPGEIVWNHIFGRIQHSLKKKYAESGVSFEKNRPEVVN